MTPAAAMLVLALPGVGRPSMFGSEADTYWAAQLQLGKLVRLLSHVDAVHGTYYLMVHTLFVVGPSPTLMRVPSALAAAGAAAMVSVLAVRLTGSRWVGLPAGLLYAVLPSVLLWAQSGRSYALVSCAVTIVVLLLLRATDGDGGSRRRWMAFAAATAATGYLHEMTLLLIPAFAITLTWARVGRRTMAYWAAATAAAVLLIAPLLVLSVRERAAVAHLERPDLRSIEVLCRAYFGPSQALACVLVACATIGVAAGALRPRNKPDAPSTGRTVQPEQLLLPMLIVPASSLFVVSRLSTSLFDDRYVQYGTVPATLLAAVGLNTVGAAATQVMRNQRLRPVVALIPAIGLCIAAAVLWSPSAAKLRTPAGYAEDYGASSRFLAAHARPGDGLVFATQGARNAELGYPFLYRGLVDIRLGRSPLQTETFRGTTASHRAREGRLARLNRVWIVGSYPPPRGREELRLSLPGLFSDFAPARIAHFTGVDDVLLVRVHHQAGAA